MTNLILEVDLRLVKVISELYFIMTYQDVGLT